MGRMMVFPCIEVARTWAFTPTVHMLLLIFSLVCGHFSLLRLRKRKFELCLLKPSLLVVLVIVSTFFTGIKESLDKV
jgi:hypothetical protein